MGLFTRRDRNTEDDRQSAIEIIELKKKAHRTAEQADKDIKRLNKLLRADGITLKIHIASGGHRG